MNSSFVPTRLDDVLDGLTPSDLASTLAEARGSPRTYLKFSGKMAQVWAVGPVPDNDDEIRDGAAQLVLTHLLAGSLVAYVECGDRAYSIPSGFWTMRTQKSDAWQFLAAAFEAFPYAPGFQEAMVGKTILIPRTSAAAFIKRQMANGAPQPENDDDPGTGDPGRPITLEELRPSYGEEPAVRTAVDAEEFRMWMADRIANGWTQTKIVKEASAAFPKRVVPGREDRRDIHRKEYRRKMKVDPKPGKVVL